MPDQSRWFALTVKPKHEKTAAQVLENKGLQGFVPTYRSRRAWSDRVKMLEMPLFPGYVFCRFLYRDRLTVLTTPGITSIVAFGERPAPVNEEELAAVRIMVASGLPVQPWACIRPGERVRIEEGALRGLEGLLVRDKGDLRVVVNVELLQRAVAVELDRDAVRRLAA